MNATTNTDAESDTPTGGPLAGLVIAAPLSCLLWVVVLAALVELLK